MPTLWGQQLWKGPLWWGSEAPAPVTPDVLSIDLATTDVDWQDVEVTVPVWYDVETVDSQFFDQRQVQPFWIDDAEIDLTCAKSVIIDALWNDNCTVEVKTDTIGLNPFWLDDASVVNSLQDVSTMPANWPDDEGLNPDWLDVATLELARYGMTALNNNLKPIVRGDTRKIQRTFTGLPVGETISKAWLTVKSTPAASDPGLFQVEITATETSSGQVTDATSTDGQIGMYFIISGTNSALATGGAEYLYDIQVKTSTNTIHTLVMGTVTFYNGVTAATS